MELLKGLSNGNILIGMRSVVVRKKQLHYNLINRFINSQPTSIDVDIANLLADWNIKEMNETTLDFGISTQEAINQQVTLLPMKLMSYSLLMIPKQN